MPQDGQDVANRLTSGLGLDSGLWARLVIFVFARDRDGGIGLRVDPGFEYPPPYR